MRISAIKIPSTVLIRCITLALLVTVYSCADDEAFPLEYCYDRITSEDCRFYKITDNGPEEINVNISLRDALQETAIFSLDEIVTNALTGIPQCIELIDENNAKLSSELNGTRVEEVVPYDLENETLGSVGASLLLLEGNNSLELVISTSILFLGDGNLANPFANQLNYQEAASTDFEQNLLALEYELDYIIGDTVGICLPRIVYK